LNTDFLFAPRCPSVYCRDCAKIATGQPTDLIALVVHAHTGYRTIGNSFALVLKETRHAALLMRLPKRIFSQGSHGLEGHEVPMLDNHILTNKSADTVFRAKRSVDDQGRVNNWDGQNLYSICSRQPIHFSHLD
jgi:hypothetical protein